MRHVRVEAVAWDEVACNAHRRCCIAHRRLQAVFAPEYPLGVALSDLYVRCDVANLPGALDGVTQPVVVQEQAAQGQLADLLSLSRSKPATFLQHIPGKGFAWRARSECCGPPVRNGRFGNYAQQESVARKLGWAP